MGYSIPVMFTICDDTVVPLKVDSWHDVQPLLSMAGTGATGFPVHTATGTNWGQIDAIRQVRDRDCLRGLEFLDLEVAVLSGDALQIASDSLRTVLEVYEPGTSEADTSVDVRTTGLRIDCDVDGGLALFLMALLGVLDAATRSRRAFLFVQPQP